MGVVRVFFDTEVGVVLTIPITHRTSVPSLYLTPVEFSFRKGFLRVFLGSESVQSGLCEAVLVLEV